MLPVKTLILTLSILAVSQTSLKNNNDGIKIGTGVPSLNCNVGDRYLDDAAAREYLCIAANNWTPSLVEMKSIIPAASEGGVSMNNITFSTNTVMSVGKISIPYKINASQIVIRSGSSHTTNGTVKISLYSEDGQTSLFSVTSPTISATATFYPISISPSVIINPGMYWISVVTVGTTNTSLIVTTQNGVAASGYNFAQNGKAASEGTLTVTAGTPPASFTPTDITYAYNSTLRFRIDQ
jgi:hypothetical protein